MPKITDEKKAARREQILAAARRCFAEHGYEGATVARIEAATGLSRGAIFNYFASKEELFLALADDDKARFGALWLERGFGGLLRALLAEDRAWLGVYLEVTHRLRTDEAFRERWKRRAPDVEERIAARIGELRATGELRDDVSERALGQFMGVVADGLIIRLAAGFDGLDEDVIRLAEEATRPRARPRRRGRRSA